MSADLPPITEENPTAQPTEDDPYVRGVWHVAMGSRSLKRGQMAARTFFGEPILFARRTDGTVFAIRDLCPHRGIPLRFGRFDGETVGCAYHGWRFGGDGRCTLIPSLTEAQGIDVSKIRCGAWPVAERQGLIWIYLADPEVPGDATPPEPWTFPDVGERAPQADIALTYETDFDNAAFGMMDPAHIAFVHSAWWMKRDETTLRRKEKRFEPAELGWRMAEHKIAKLTPAHRLLGREVRTEITLRLPGFRIERIWGERHSILNLLAITPIDRHRTQMVQALWWTMKGLDWLAPLVRSFGRRFLGQDGDIILKQNEGLKHKPRQMLVADADAQMFWWLRVKREWRAHRREGRAFEHPVQARTLVFRS